MSASRDNTCKLCNRFYFSTLPGRERSAPWDNTCKLGNGFYFSTLTLRERELGNRFNFFYITWERERSASLDNTCKLCNRFFFSVLPVRERGRPPETTLVSSVMDSTQWWDGSEQGYSPRGESPVMPAFPPTTVLHDKAYLMTVYM